MNYEAVDRFLDLFSEEQRLDWAMNGAPDWVIEGLTFFFKQDPGHQDLMERLKDS